MSDTAARYDAGGNSFLERRFRFAQNGTTLGRDTMAGVTTFIVMSYIIFVNPQILSFAGIEGLSDIGLPFDQVLAATCLVAGVMTVVMGLYTNKAYALAPGLGLNAVVAFSLVAGEGLSFPAAMGLIVVEGIAVTILVLTGLRERIMDAIPLDLKKAIAIGIGLFIAFIGLESAGIVVSPPGDAPILALGHLTTWPIFVTFFGLLLTVALRARGVRGDLLIGIVATTILATLINELDDNAAGFTAGRQLARRRLRDPRPGAPRELQLRRVHRAGVHLRGCLGLLALPRRLLRHDGHARRRRQAGGLPGRARPHGRDPQAAARRLARGGRGRRGVDVVGDDLHRVRFGRRRRAAAQAGSPWWQARSSSRSCSSRRSSAWSRRRRRRLP